MKRTILAAAPAAALACLIAAPLSAGSHDMSKSGAHGHEMSAPVMATAVWARATPGKAANGGAYMTIRNAGTQPDRLVAAASDVAGRVEIHTHINDDGVMRMRRVDGVDIPPGKTVTFKPGGYHVMLMGLHKPLKEGDKFEITLTFEKAGNQTVEVDVKQVGAMGPGMGRGHTGH